MMDAVCYHAVRTTYLLFNRDAEANHAVQFLIHQPRQLDIISSPIPQIAPDQVLLKGMPSAFTPECIMTNRTPPGARNSNMLWNMWDRPASGRSTYPERFPSRASAV